MATGKQAARERAERARFVDGHLSSALAEGDLVLAQAAIAAGANPNRRGPDGERPLTAAARWGGAAAVVKSLLARGARVDFMNATSQTPLMIASAAGRLAIARLLLGAGADADRANRNQETALTYAVVWQKPKLIELLLHAGADVEQRSLSWSPLMHAANAGDPRAVALLLEFGADAGRTDQWGRTAYDIAREPRYDELLTELTPTARQREATRLLGRASAKARRSSAARR
jgi:ankyrin repeat protein